MRTSESALTFSSRARCNFTYGQIQFPFLLARVNTFWLLRRRWTTFGPQAGEGREDRDREGPRLAAGEGEKKKDSAPK